LEKVGDNTYKMSLFLYILIYSTVNAEHLKLYDPSMLDQEVEDVLPTIQELSLDAQEYLEEESILQRKSKTRRQGKHDRWWIRLKGQLPRKEKCYSRKKVEGKLPHLI
jgi:hypothetical protein